MHSLIDTLHQTLNDRIMDLVYSGKFSDIKDKKILV